jgi:hypothetical protein
MDRPASPFLRCCLSIVFVTLPLAAGCSEDPTAPAEEPVRTFMVAAADSAFVDLARDTTVVRSTSSAAWDVGLWQTAVFLNAQGSAPVLAVCLCQNAGASGDQIRAMTAASELPYFEGVTADAIPPAGAAWSGTVFSEKRWYRYNLTGTDHQIWPTFDVYLVKTGDGVYKVQFTSYYNAVGEPRHVTFRFARLAG